MENTILAVEKKVNHYIGNTSLPMTMDLYHWGNVFFNESDNSAFINKDHSNFNYKVNIFDLHHEIEVINDKGDIILYFRDTLLFPRRNDDLTYFKRDIFNKVNEVTKKIVYKNYEVLLKTNIKKLKFIKKIQPHKNISDKFISMDIETKTVNNKMVPICISLFDGDISKSFFVNDFLNPSEMITSSIHYLLKRKYHNYKIYFHNFSSFDSIFNLKELSQISNKIKPTIRESRIIELKCSFGTKKKPINLYFRDSLLLLPLSLEKLAINFLSDSSGKKELFPYEFINRNDIGLEYIGEIPERKYFNNVNEQLYNEYKQSFILNNSNENVWNLKKETIKYCESDVTTLKNIITIFQKIIFYHFSLDILKNPTLPHNK